MVEETKVTNLDKDSEVKDSGISNKRTISNDTSEPKKVKSKRRRRNYDELDEEIVKGDKQLKTGSGSEDNDSDVDDEKLDQMMAKEEEEEDDLSEIDTANIISTGRRTRGKVIDYKKTAEELDSHKDGKSKAINEEEEEDDEDGEFTETVTEK